MGRGVPEGPHSPLLTSVYRIHKLAALEIFNGITARSTDYFYHSNQDRIAPYRLKNVEVLTQVRGTKKYRARVEDTEATNTNDIGAGNFVNNGTVAGTLGAS